MCGSLSQIKSTYRRDEYVLQTESDAHADMLVLAFPKMHRKEKCTLSFLENECGVFDVMRFITDRHIPVLRLERTEPTLEALFMEVAE